MNDNHNQSRLAESFLGAFCATVIVLGIMAMLAIVGLLATVIIWGLL